jgi:hypothetical protein
MVCIFMQRFTIYNAIDQKVDIRFALSCIDISIIKECHFSF